MIFQIQFKYSKNFIFTVFRIELQTKKFLNIVLYVQFFSNRFFSNYLCSGKQTGHGCSEHAVKVKTLAREQKVADGRARRENRGHR